MSPLTLLTSFIICSVFIYLFGSFEILTFFTSHFLPHFTPLFNCFIFKIITYSTAKGLLKRSAKVRLPEHTTAFSTFDPPYLI